MKKKILLPLMAIALLVSGCEFNGVTSEQISKDIIREAEGICGATEDTPRGGVQNIMLMDGREDDGIVTCRKTAPGDRTLNHYFDG